MSHSVSHDTFARGSSMQSFGKLNGVPAKAIETDISGKVRDIVDLVGLDMKMQIKNPKYRNNITEESAIATIKAMLA